MQYLTADDVIAFYQEAVGTPVLRYRAGLDSAVARPQSSAFGEDAYLTVSLKAAALMQLVAENQPFLDGNKRIAWICAKLFVQLHGVTMHASDDEALDLFVNKVAKGMTVEEISEWIDRHVSACSSPWCGWATRTSTKPYSWTQAPMSIGPTTNG